MSSKQVYDASPEQLEIMRWRDAKRRQLRELYMKDAGHPTKSLLFDTGIYRYSAMKATMEHNFVPRAYNFLLKVGGIGFVLIVTGHYIIKDRRTREHMYRTGQVSYADRTFKFT